MASDLMSARYIARKYGGAGDSSPERPASRALSRPPSSRGTSVAPVSRGPSPTPSYYYAGSRDSSRATTPNNNPQQLTSRRLRERSIPPPALLPERIEPVRAPGKPPPSPRVVASDFYKGKVKSIYEREPLFEDFCRTIPSKYGHINIYNTDTLDTLKTDFKSMVDDKWKRMSCRDPSVEMNFGAKVYPWRDLAVKEREPASARIFRSHDARGPRATTPVNMPRVYVYHRSTRTPAPAIT